jgi:hypothetical protein
MQICADLVRMLKPGGALVVTFATGQTLPTGEYMSWPLHHRAETLVHELQQQGIISAALHVGPDSRQYNNVAIVVHT